MEHYFTEEPKSLILAPLLQGAVERLKRGGSLQIVVGTIKGGENILKGISEPSIAGKS